MRTTRIIPFAVLWLLSVACLGVSSEAQTVGPIGDYCNLGATKAVVSNLPSSNYLQGVSPTCTVQVFLTGTTTQATLYANGSLTPLANPFLAATSGQYLFYASLASCYDIVLSGGTSPNTYPSPVTLTGRCPSAAPYGGDFVLTKPPGGQVVKQPVVSSNQTYLETNALNGFNYASQFCLPANCSSNNGIINALGSGGQSVVAEPNYNSSENLTYETLPSSGTVQDYRQGGIRTDFINPTGTLPYSTAVYGRFDEHWYNETVVSQQYQAEWMVANCTGAGYDNGASGTAAEGWFTCYNLGLQGNIYPRGIHNILQVNGTFYGIGDDPTIASYIDFYGGCVASSDECNVHHEISDTQLNYLTIGACLTNCTSGATQVTTNLVWGGTFNDGAQLIWLPAVDTGGTISSYGTYSGSGSLNTWYVNLSTSNWSPSTAWGTIIPSSCTNNGNGQYQLYTSTTCSVTLTTASPGPVSPGNFQTTANGGVVCMSGPFFECPVVTAVGVPSGGVQTITFNTRYAWDNSNGNANAAVVMQGGIAGYSLIPGSGAVSITAGSITSHVGTFTATNSLVAGQIVTLGNFSSTPSINGVSGFVLAAGLSSSQFEIALPVANVASTGTGTFNSINSTVPNVASWPLAYPVVGCVTASGGGARCVFAAGAQGSWNGTGGNVYLLPDSTTVDIYPSAEIIGTCNGTNNCANLSANAINFASGGWMLSTPASSLGYLGVRYAANLTTPCITYIYSNYCRGVEVDDEGNSPLGAAFQASNNQPRATAAPYGILFGSPHGYYQDLLASNTPPTGSAMLINGDSTGDAFDIFFISGGTSTTGYLQFAQTGGLLTYNNEFSAANIIDSGLTSDDCVQAGTGGLLTTVSGGCLTTTAAASTYAPIASPTFTGTVTIPSGASISGFAPLASPALSGTPTAPTASASTNTTQVATTAFVRSQILMGTTSTITGTSLSATCDSGTVSVTNAVVGSPVAVSSTTGADVGGAFNVRGSVTSSGTVTVYVCGTGTPSSLAYNVAVIQ